MDILPRFVHFQMLSMLNPTITSKKASQALSCGVEFGRKKTQPSKSPSWTTHPGKAPRQNSRDALSRSKMNGLQEKQEIPTARFSSAVVRQFAGSPNLFLFFKKFKVAYAYPLPTTLQLESSTQRNKNAHIISFTLIF